MTYMVKAAKMRSSFDILFFEIGVFAAGRCYLKHRLCGTHNQRHRDRLTNERVNILSKKKLKIFGGNHG